MKKVLLLYGGNSPEHNISCLSAYSIIQNIDKSKYDFHCVEIKLNNIWYENQSEIPNIIEYLKEFDVVFPITHGKNGEDGSLQGMLDLFQINYIGCKCGPSYICMDKERTKQILSFLNIPQVHFEIYNKKKKLKLEYPLIIKPSNGGSSIGINKVNNKKEYIIAIEKALQYDNKVIIEKFIKMREIECAILQNKDKLIMNLGEIISSNEFYDYNAKYDNQESKTITEINLPRKVENSIKKYAKTIFKEFQLDGFARIDFFYDEENNQIYVNEINTIPGFTNISMFPKLIMQLGYSYSDIIDILISNIQKT